LTIDPSLSLTGSSIHILNIPTQLNRVDPSTMGKILGHKDIETTMIYTHQIQEHLKKRELKIQSCQNCLKCRLRLTPVNIISSVSDIVFSNESTRSKSPLPVDVNELNALGK
jgi:hypothetical protein